MAAIVDLCVRNQFNGVRRGTDRYLQDVELMIGSMKNWRWFFKVFWQFLSPLTLMGVLLFNLIQYAPIKYDKYSYPAWADGIGWILSLFPILWIIGSIVWKIYQVKEDMTVTQKIFFLLKPSKDWGPAHKIPKFDLQDLEKEKHIENPNFISSNDSMSRM